MKLKKEAEQAKNNKLKIELEQRRNKAHEKYHSLYYALTFFTGDTEYWNSDLPKRAEERLELYKQELVQIEFELFKFERTKLRRLTKKLETTNALHYITITYRFMPCNNSNVYAFTFPGISQ